MNSFQVAQQAIESNGIIEYGVDMNLFTVD